MLWVLLFIYLFLSVASALREWACTLGVCPSTVLLHMLSIGVFEPCVEATLLPHLCSVCVIISRLNAQGAPLAPRDAISNRVGAWLEGSWCTWLATPHGPELSVKAKSMVTATFSLKRLLQACGACQDGCDVNLVISGSGAGGDGG